VPEPSRQNPVDSLRHSTFTPDVADSPAPSDTGLLVLSSSMRILHINDRARTLMARFGEAFELWPHLSPESIPAILSEFCGNVFAELAHQAPNGKWAEFELRRVCYMVNPAILIRGFGMPSMHGQEPRMILTLQPYASSIDAMVPPQPGRSATRPPDFSPPAQ